MELYFLGTGAGLPSRDRNVTSVALLMYQERGTYWMFDAGEATQHQLLRSPLKPGKLEKLFITHLHGDHIYGIPGLLASRSFQSTGGPHTVYGPVGVKMFIQTCLSTGQTHLTYPLEIVELGEEGLVFDDGQFLVVAERLDHGIECFGYRVVEHDQPGPFLPDKAKAQGIQPGPIFRELKNGKTVRLPDGRTVHGKDFVGPPIAGRKVAVLGDTRYCSAAARMAREVDVLVHESTFASADAELAHNYFHSTSVQAASIAKQAGARALILTHISARYQADSADGLLAEARSVFHNTELAQDFSTYPITPNSFSKNA